MGSNHSIQIIKNKLLLGEVRENDIINGRALMLYYKPAEEIYVMDPHETAFKTGEPEIKSKIS